MSADIERRQDGTLLLRCSDQMAAFDRVMQMAAEHRCLRRQIVSDDNVRLMHLGMRCECGVGWATRLMDVKARPVKWRELLRTNQDRRLLARIVSGTILVEDREP